MRDERSRRLALPTSGILLRRAIHAPARRSLKPVFGCELFVARPKHFTIHTRRNRKLFTAIHNPPPGRTGGGWRRARRRCCGQECPRADGVPIWKSATRQVWKPALQAMAFSIKLWPLVGTPRCGVRSAQRADPTSRLATAVRFRVTCHASPVTSRRRVRTKTGVRRRRHANSSFPGARCCSGSSSKRLCRTGTSPPRSWSGRAVQLPTRAW